MEGLTIGMICIYFQFIGRNALVYLTVMNVIYFACVMSAYFVAVESPKWFVIKGLQEQARETLLYIAHFNNRFASKKESDEDI